jgi:hypothetical protein
MDFIKELHEARMTRNSSDQAELTYTDVLERLYITICILDFGYKFATYRRQISDYAKKTTMYSGYNHFRMHGTDLHNLIYFATGDESAISKLKNPEAAQALRNKTHVPLLALNRYLSAMAIGTSLKSSDRSILLELERYLNITNTLYKKTRRQLMNFAKLQQVEREEAATNLLLASRAKLRNSDIHSLLEKIVIDRNLETSLVKDNEPTVSKPDTTPTDMTGVMMYRYLLGSKTNYALIKGFLERVERGETIPSQMTKAYAPAIKILNDIVKAGPAYTNIVHLAHKRAQKK